MVVMIGGGTENPTVAEVAEGGMSLDGQSPQEETGVAATTIAVPLAKKTVMIETTAATAPKKNVREGAEV